MTTALVSEEEGTKVHSDPEKDFLIGQVSLWFSDFKFPIISRTRDAVCRIDALQPSGPGFHSWIRVFLHVPPSKCMGSLASSYSPETSPLG